MKLRTLLVALVGVGGYLAWRYRYAIQRQLEELGVLPLGGAEEGEALQSSKSEQVGRQASGF